MHVIYKHAYSKGPGSERFCRWGAWSKNFGAIITLDHLPKLETVAKFWSNQSWSNKGGSQVNLHQGHTGQQSTSAYQGTCHTTCQQPGDIMAYGASFPPKVHSCYKLPSARFLLVKRTLVPTQGTHFLSRTVGRGPQGFFCFRSKRSIQGWVTLKTLESWSFLDLLSGIHLLHLTRYICYRREKTWPWSSNR